MGNKKGGIAEIIELHKYFDRQEVAPVHKVFTDKLRCDLEIEYERKKSYVSLFVNRKCIHRGRNMSVYRALDLEKQLELEKELKNEETDN